MVDAAYDAEYVAAARAQARRYALGRVGVYAFLTLFALIYLLPLFVVVANSFRELPEITQNGLIAFPRSFSLQAWPQRLGALLRRRHLRGRAAQLLQLADDDDPGDDRLDACSARSTATCCRNGASAVRSSCSPA